MGQNKINIICFYSNAQVWLLNTLPQARRPSPSQALLFTFHQDPSKDGEGKIKADFAELNEQMEQAFRSLED